MDPCCFRQKIQCLRTDITCQSPVELQYYSSGLGLADLCARCSLNAGRVSTDLLKRYKTALPLCDECKDTGNSVIVQKSYGKNCVEPFLPLIVE